MKSNQGAVKNVLRTTANDCVKSCKKLAAQVGLAKEKLLAELQGTLNVPERFLRLALGEAEALAWQTGYPHLVFPALATEKIQAVAGWNARQQFIRQKSAGAMSI